MSPGFLSFCIHGSIRQLQINAIQFLNLISSITINTPLTFIRLICASPCWDNVYLYHSDKVAVPFVAPLLFDGWHSNAVLYTRLQLFRLSWAKRCIGWALQAKMDLQNIMRVCEGAFVPGLFTETEKDTFLPVVRAHWSNLGLLRFCLIVSRSLSN